MTQAFGLRAMGAIRFRPRSGQDMWVMISAEALGYCLVSLRDSSFAGQEVSERHRPWLDAYAMRRGRFLTLSRRPTSEPRSIRAASGSTNDHDPVKPLWGGGKV
jgi:hypothetical protein